MQFIHAGKREIAIARPDTQKPAPLAGCGLSMAA